jgi:hypothetical protein
MMSLIMLSAIMLSVVMPGVVAPASPPWHNDHKPTLVVQQKVDKS